MVILLRGGDMFSPDYVARMAAVAEAGAVARPAACLTYGGAPGLRLHESLEDGAADPARLIFAPPFAPPLAARRDHLLRLAPRPWSLEADWAWTRDSLASGLRHVVAREAVYVAWSPTIVAPVLLPAIATPPPPSAPPSEPASEADTLALLYRRGALARVNALEAEIASRDARLSEASGAKANLQAKLGDALSQAQTAKVALKAMRASTSWKATAPLRALVARGKSDTSR